MVYIYIRFNHTHHFVNIRSDGVVIHSEKVSYLFMLFQRQRSPVFSTLHDTTKQCFIDSFILVR
jgi:hypothetical protein